VAQSTVWQDGNSRWADIGTADVTVSATKVHDWIGHLTNVDCASLHLQLCRIRNRFLGTPPAGISSEHNWLLTGLYPVADFSISMLRKWVGFKTKFAFAFEVSPLSKLFWFFRNWIYLLLSNNKFAWEWGGHYYRSIFHTHDPYLEHSAAPQSELAFREKALTRKTSAANFFIASFCDCKTSRVACIYYGIETSGQNPATKYWSFGACRSHALDRLCRDRSEVFNSPRNTEFRRMAVILDIEIIGLMYPEEFTRWKFFLNGFQTHSYHQGLVSPKWIFR